MRRLAALVAVAVLATVATPASAQTPTASFNIWHWNVAGSSQRDRITDDGRSQTISNSISSPNQLNDFATLNELCLQQYKLIQEKLRNKGWPEDPSNFSRWSQTLPANSGRCGGEAVGNAVFSKHPLVTGSAGRIIYSLPENDYTDATARDDYDRTLMCVTPQEYTTVRICVTHTTYLTQEVVPGTSYKERQLLYVRDRMEALHDQGLTAILSGDLNAGANFAELNPLYSPAVNSYTARRADGTSVISNNGNTGKYRELDDTDNTCPGYGERTIEEEFLTNGSCGIGVKIDFIFVREDRLADTNYQAWTASPYSINCDGNCSDHRLLRGRVTVKY